MKKITVLIIDDEPLARGLIKEFCSEIPQLEILDECRNGLEAIKKITLLKPDLIFLDIQMPVKNGFEVLEEIENLPLVIFTTAYDEFAVKAFEKSAIDYLLKPFDEERFLKSARKAINFFEVAKSQKPNIFFVRKGNKLKFLEANEILYFEASNDYVEIFTEKENFLVSKPLAKIELQLVETSFVRVHRSFLANPKKCTKIENIGEGKIELFFPNGKSIVCSRTGSTKIRKMIL